MRVDIHTRKIGDELLIPVWLSVEDQQPLLLLGCRSEPLGPEKNTEFQRHVESWKLGGGIQLRPRNVMNAITALSNQTIKLLDPRLTTIIHFPGGSRAETACINRKN